MSFRKKAEKFKDDLEKRHKESGERKDEGMSSDIFLHDKLKEYMPNGVNIWRPELGAHEIDIIPYLAGSQHPRDPEGRPSYCVDVWVYQRVGALGLQFVSPARMYKQTDPILEHIRREDLTKDQFKKVAAKRRVIYLIWCHDTPEEEEKGIQIWDVAHFYMEKNIERIAAKAEVGGYVKFSHHDTGKRIAFDIVSEGKWVDENNIERDSISYLGHCFINRPGDGKIPDKILDTNFPLDEVINMKPSYNDIYTAFHGKPPVEGETSAPEEKSRLVRKGPPVTVDTSTPPDPANEVQGPTDDIPDDQTQAEEAIGACPHGGTWGIDNEKKDECNACELWDPCSDAQIEMKNLGTDDAPGEDTQEEQKETKEPEKKETPKKKKPIVRRKVK